MLFDFEWTNKNLFGDQYDRTGSFWQNSELSALGVPASAGEKLLLSPYMDKVDPRVHGWDLATSQNRWIWQGPRCDEGSRLIAGQSWIHDQRTDDGRCKRQSVCL